MIGLDTNVLVRYIVQDDPEQAARATELIESRCTRDQPGHIDTVVLCELVWVLERAYGYSRPTVSAVLRQLFSTAELNVAAPDAAWAALRAYEQDSADYADYLVGARNRSAGCGTTYTFDRRASRSAWHSPVP